MQLVVKNEDSDIEEFKRDQQRTISLECCYCGHRQRYTINEINEDRRCRKCHL